MTGLISLDCVSSICNEQYWRSGLTVSFSQPLTNIRYCKQNDPYQISDLGLHCCLCPIKRTLGLYIRKLASMSLDCTLCPTLMLFTFVCIILSCLFLAALWSPAGEGLISWLSCVWCWFPSVLITFPLVLDCIDSWSLPSSLLIGIINSHL